MRGIGDEDFLARTAPLSQCRANHHQTGHLCLGAGGRLSGHFRKPGYLSETLFDAEDYLKRTLSEWRGGERMEIREAVDASDLLVDSRIVFHRARAQRIQAVIDAIVPRGQPCEVSDYIHFR